MASYEHHRSRSSRDKARGTKAWELWSRGGYEDEDHFIAAFADKGNAQRRAALLKRSHPRVHYFLKHRASPRTRHFERAHTKKSARRHTSHDPSKRNVRWLEERQDRAATSADRVGRLNRHLVDRVFELKREADEMEREARRIKARAPKKSAKLMQDAAAKRQRAEAYRERALKLADSAGARRVSGHKYGRAKTYIGKYDPATGWSDRDARRARFRRR